MNVRRAYSSRETNSFLEAAPKMTASAVFSDGFLQATAEVGLGGRNSGRSPELSSFAAVALSGRNGIAFSGGDRPPLRGVLSGNQ